MEIMRFHHENGNRWRDPRELHAAPKGDQGWGRDHCNKEREGKPVAKIIAMGPKKSIDWPDFFDEAVEIKGKPVSEIVIENREGRQSKLAIAAGLRIEDFRKV
jgi:hypothetical protein